MESRCATPTAVPPGRDDHHQPARRPQRQGLVLNTRDVSERKELEDQLVHEAFHDALTSLANRALFEDRVEQALRRRSGAEASPVLFLDLDGFKEVNDSLGHAAGDQLLVQVADRLRPRSGPRTRSPGSAATSSRSSSSRSSSTTSTNPRSVAKRILDGLRSPSIGNGQICTFVASIGIASAGADADDADQLMRNADLAMYRAKSTGEGGFAEYDPEMHIALVERLQLEADLRRGLEVGEFELPTSRPSICGPARSSASRRWPAGGTRSRGLVSSG